MNDGVIYKYTQSSLLSGADEYTSKEGVIARACISASIPGRMMYEGRGGY